MKWTAEQALTNWRNAFDSGHYTAARAWWAIYWHDGDADPADTFYYDLTVLGGNGVERIHGWAHVQSKRIVQEDDGPLARWRAQGEAEQARIDAIMETL